MSLVLVTGASRGFGRALALAFTEELSAANEGDLYLHLWSRDTAGLAATTEAIQATWKSQDQALHVTQTAVDLSDQRAYCDTINNFLSDIAKLSLKRIVIVHNAGSLGEVGRIANVSSPQAIQKHMELNVNSVLWFNKRFLEAYGQASSGEKPQIYMLNVSSLNAIEPFATCGLYCVFKAARDMHFRVVAIEEPNVKTLNYAPGPMETEMNNALRTGPSTDASLQTMFQKLHAEGNMVDVNVSARLCVKHLLGSTLVSGSHVDYYDIYQST
ncbi:hypothetical protein LEN26_001260 [Aphanomyces euteiches]|nr:hypothetical protein Ae201684P_017980 [Aphanomyces euteiches]KAH9103421.1 hypothetical protein AeMF1_020238 [Aphanomyces euteiches]KAH9111371.1 hypothetical protein AeMF1_014076 [Aphanomyces euteiches]KAH9122838.1 hypothetical protein AeMF1_006020 [Aphanomyces euteiches]KAH9124773.1 hypothetical protein AeMF1_004503 [Aphanomyces euteiches]